MKCKTDALTLHNKRAGNTVGTGKRMRGQEISAGVYAPVIRKRKCGKGLD